MSFGVVLEMNVGELKLSQIDMGLKAKLLLRKSLVMEEQRKRQNLLCLVLTLVQTTKLDDATKSARKRTSYASR